MAPSRRSWLKWALVASVALNLAFAGLVAGALIKGPPPAPWPGIALFQYARALPDPYRDDLRDSLRERRQEWKDAREALRDQRRALATALTAEPYAPETVADLLHREVTLTSELSGRGADLLLAQIERMSPQDRAGYAAALLEDRGPTRSGRHDRRPCD